MASWFWKKRGASGSGKGAAKVVLDGSDIEELVENRDAFNSYVDHKFQELDRDRDGKLSVKELEPAVADIGAALGLPAQGSSPDSDHIYSEVSSCFILFLFFCALIDFGATVGENVRLDNAEITQANKFFY